MMNMTASAWVVTVLFLASTMAVVVAVRGSTSEITVISASGPEIPPARSNCQMAYDSESNRIVMFGGGISDTWAYDVSNSNWQNMNPTNAPPARHCQGMAYDSKADRVVLFGGYDAGITNVLDDTWIYDLNGNTWTQMMPSVSPPGRTGGQLVYDVQLDRIILFGGHADASDNYLAKNDTWTYDLDSNTWNQVTTTTSPTLRAFAVMAYDTESDRVVLFGGMTEPSSLPDSETWMYDPFNETWAKMTPTSSPAPRFGAAGVYDAEVDRILVFGGGSNNGCNDTWAYDLNADEWSRINTASSPSDRLSTMAYDARSDRTVLFGGLWPWPSGNAYDETWVFDRGNSTWTMVLPDIVSPTLAITSPADGSSLASKDVTITGTASDNFNIAKVEVSLDNANWTMATGTTSWSATLFLAEGKNTIYVRATDTSGNTATSTFHVTVPAQGIPVWVWAVVAIGVGGAAVASYVMVRRRKKIPGEER